MSRRNVLMGKRLFEPDLKSDPSSPTIFWASIFLSIYQSLSTFLCLRTHRETANAVAAAAVAAAAAGVTESRSLPGRRRNAISLPTLHSVQGITRIQSTEDLDDDAETLIGDEEYDEEWEDSEDDLKNNKDKDEGMDKDNNDEGAPTGRNG
ncbi:hypothetical protein IWX50DRAFT_678312 [Phyllosticta citricarpa]